jgi:hypothetical protein
LSLEGQTALGNGGVHGSDKNRSLSKIEQEQKQLGSRRYSVTLVSLFASVVGLSGTDMLTTWMALNEGLKEGNLALLSFARIFDLSFFQAIALTKVGFILGAGVLVVFGMRSNIQSTRSIVMKSMIAFAILLLFVSLNNLVMIFQ